MALKYLQTVRRWLKSDLIRRMVVLASGCLIVLALFRITPGPSKPFDEPTAEYHLPIPRSSEKAAIPVFRDRTLEAGIRFVHQQGGERLTGLNETLGAGACAFDYDNDGWLDLFAVGGSGQTHYHGRRQWWQPKSGNALYRNTGDGRFEDVTDRAGLTRTVWGMGCSYGDLDNDGDQDLLVTALGANVLYRNNGDGTFTDITETSGLHGEQWSTSAALADYDGDGLLDIYIVNYIRYEKGSRTYETNSAFMNASSPAFNASLYDSEANLLYRNLGSLRFREEASAAGVADKGGRGLAAVWLDANGDRLPDLFVGNDADSPNRLFLNNGKGTFGDADANYHASETQGTQGISTGDIDNDGDVDLFANASAGHLSLLLINGDSPLPFQSASHANRQFEDMGRKLGIAAEDTVSYSGWGAGLHDFNRDGWLDLLTVNGLRYPDPDSPGVPLGQHKLLWVNPGHSGFRDPPSPGSLPMLDEPSARGAAFGDFDNDGGIDVFIAHNNDPGQLLINETPPRHWLGLKLEANRSNRDAIGSKIWLNKGSNQQYREISAGGGFLSDSDRRLLFGLGEDNRNVRIDVLWPDGSKDSYMDIPVDRYVLIKQGQTGEPITKLVSGDRLPHCGPFTHCNCAPWNHHAAYSSPKTVSKWDCRSSTRSSAIGSGVKPLKTERLEVAARNRRGKKRLGLRIGAGDAGHRAQYLRWLPGAVDAATLMHELEVAIHDENAIVRFSAIRILHEYRSLNGLMLLIEALNDSAPANRIAAIEALRGYEDEYAVRRLMRLFNDEAPAVRAAAASVFAFFFREEEAVTHRKYLAVPPLVRMLQDTSPKVRAAAAQALGDTEHFRGVVPLIEALKDVDQDVRMQAARSLGLLREQRAVPGLLDLLRDAAQPAKVRAHILIALKRLHYRKTGQEIRSWLQGGGGNPGASSVSALQAMNYIVNDERDGIVFAPGTLAEITAEWLRHHRHSKQNDAIRTAIIVLKSSHSRSGIPTLKSMTRHKDASIRSLAYRAWMEIDKERAPGIAETGLKDASYRVRLAILEELRTRNIRASAPALLKAADQPKIRLPAIRLLAKYPDQKVRVRLRAYALDTNESVEVRIAALKSLSNTGKHLKPLPENIFGHDDARLRSAAISYWSKQQIADVKKMPPLLSRGLADKSSIVRQAAAFALPSRHEPWAQKTLHDILLNQHPESTLRGHLLDKLAKAGLDVRIIMELARLRHDSLSKTAIASLSHFRNTNAETLLWNILNQPNESDDLRFIAATSLQPQHHKAVILALRRSQQ